MNSTHSVISDFLDGEAFDPTALGEALADAAGRELLIDFVIMRYAAVVDEAVVPARRPRTRARLITAIAAAVLLALAVGYQLGHRQSDSTSVLSSAPEPTRVLDAATWQTVTQENRQ
jgi:hypothetical protein